MPRRRPRTKAELIARIFDGPFSVERDAVVLWYRLTLPEDAERRDAVVIALAPEFGFVLQEYDADSAYVVVQGQIAPLTRWQADAVATRMRQMLRVHGGTLTPRTPARLRAGSIVPRVRRNKRSA